MPLLLDGKSSCGIPARFPAIRAPAGEKTCIFDSSRRSERYEHPRFGCWGVHSVKVFRALATLGDMTGLFLHEGRDRRRRGVPAASHFPIAARSWPIWCLLSSFIIPRARFVEVCHRYLLVSGAGPGAHEATTWPPEPCKQLEGPAQIAARTVVVVGQGRTRCAGSNPCSRVASHESTITLYNVEVRGRLKRHWLSPNR